MPVRGRIGERIDHTEAGCIEERVGHIEAGCVGHTEVREHRGHCVGRRGLHALLHIYIISVSVYPLYITTSAMEGVVELGSKFDAGGLTRAAVT